MSSPDDVGLSDQSPLRREMSVADWTFAFALPTSRRTYMNALAVGEYCHNRPINTWQAYRRTVLSAFEQYIVPFEQKESLSIVRSPTSRKFSRLLVRDRGVILFAHCNSLRKTIEFSDGMQPYGVIVRRVSPNFCGIADISACNPVGFDTLLKTQAPRCAVRVMQAYLSPIDWLKFFQALFSRFRAPSCYGEAILLAMHDIGI